MTHKNVFKRKGKNSLPRGVFYFAIGIVFAWGFIVSYSIATLATILQLSFLIAIALGPTLLISGWFLSKKGGAIYSFFGYHILITGIAIASAPVLEFFRSGLHRTFVESVGLAGIATLATAFLGLAVPGLYGSKSRTLLGACIAIIATTAFSPLVPTLAASGAIAWFTALFFATYLAYDFYRARHTRATMRNAIDVSIYFYVDILNVVTLLLKHIRRKNA